MVAWQMPYAIALVSSDERHLGALHARSGRLARVLRREIVSGPNCGRRRSNGADLITASATGGRRA